MRTIVRFILYSKNEVKASYVWNMIAAFSNSFQSMIIMLIMTRTGYVEAASYVAIGFAAANLMMTIGKFGIRNFQVTDVTEKFDFSCYKQSRYITVSVMVLCSFLYCVERILGAEYSFEKAEVVFLFCLYKTIEALEDVYHGRLQQKGRLDIAAKIWAVRNIFFIIEFLIVFLISGKLLVTLTITVATTMILCWDLNHIPVQFYVAPLEVNEEKGTWGKLIQTCFPIAVATFLLMYISNAPKYIVDTVISDEGQTYFNILFMTIYVVTLLSNFIYNPILNRLAYLWKERERSNLLRKIGVVIGIIVGIVFVGILFAEIIGRKLLGMIYSVSLESYKQELRWMLISGGLIAIMNLLYMLIILLRKPKIFYFVFAAAAFILFVFGKNVLVQWGLTRLCVFYNMVLFIVDVAFIVCVLYIICRKEEQRLYD